MRQVLPTARNDSVEPNDCKGNCLNVSMLGYLPRYGFVKLNELTMYVQIVNVPFAFGRSRGSALGKMDLPFLVNSSRCIPVKNILGWIVVVFCASEIIKLFSVAFCVVTAAHKLFFIPVINETSNKWHPVERMSCSDRKKKFFFYKIIYFSPDLHNGC